MLIPVGSFQIPVHQQRQRNQNGRITEARRIKRNRVVFDFTRSHDKRWMMSGTKRGIRQQDVHASHFPGNGRRHQIVGARSNICNRKTTGRHQYRSVDRDGIRDRLQEHSHKNNSFKRILGMNASDEFCSLLNAGFGCINANCLSQRQQLRFGEHFLMAKSVGRNAHLFRKSRREGAKALIPDFHRDIANR